MLNMPLLGFKEDEDLVKINKDISVEQVPEDVVGQSLENCRGISETKGHDQILVVTPGSVEGSFPLMSLMRTK